jgi:hypothetical protein
MYERKREKEFYCVVPLHICRDPSSARFSVKASERHADGGEKATEGGNTSGCDNLISLFLIEWTVSSL